MLTRSRTGAALLLAACAIAGCGSDESSSGSAATPAPNATSADDGSTASKPAVADRNQPSWVRAANERCREYRQDAMASAKKFQDMKSDDPAEIVEKAAAAGLPIGRALVADLREVDVPADVQQRWATFLDGLDDTFDYATDYAKVIVSGKQASPELERKVVAARKKIKPLLDAYPVSDCVPNG